MSGFLSRLLGCGRVTKGDPDGHGDYVSREGQGCVSSSQYSELVACVSSERAILRSGGGMRGALLLATVMPKVKQL